MNNREQFIVEKFSLSQDEVFKISEIGSELNTNKYNVWIAREYKKNLDLLEKKDEIFNIINWIIISKLDIMKYSFDDALIGLELYNKEKVEYKNIRKKIDLKEIDESRIIFINNDGDHFFYLLNLGDLEFESTHMDNCLFEDKSYSVKIKKQKSFIISLRNDENIPQVTIEIDSEKEKSIQVRGKNNNELSKKLNKIMVEFILFMGDINKDSLLKTINSNITFFH